MMIAIALITLCVVALSPQFALAQEDWERRMLGLETPQTLQPEVSRPLEEAVRIRPNASKTDSIKLRITDKSTARLDEITLPADTVIEYRDISLLAKRCWKDNIDHEPEEAGYISVFQNLKSGNKERVFEGWLFKRSDSLTSVEHPYYDITMLSCIAKQEEPKKE